MLDNGNRKVVYIEPPENGNQYYQDADWKSGVVAKYIRSKDPYLQGNELAEALPQPREGDYLTMGCSKPLLGYSEDNPLKNDDFIAVHEEIEHLSDVRVPVKYRAKLEMNILSAIKRSYAKRDLFVSSIGTEQFGFCVGSVTEPATVAFSLIGYPGCGKTCSIDITLENIPQKIIHNIEGTMFVQIPWLKVELPAAGDIKSLYLNVASAIDDVMNPGKNLHEAEIVSKNLSFMKMKIIQWIKLHAIGVLIIDEMQNFVVSRSKKTSFAGITEIMNSTKMPMIFVGTNCDYLQLLKTTWGARRLGPSFVADGMMSDKISFGQFVAQIMKYQWCDPIERVEPTKEIADNFFEVTKGNIDFFIFLYKFLQMEYVIQYMRAKKANKPVPKPDWSRAHIDKMVTKYLKSYHDVLVSNNSETIASKSQLIAELREELTRDFDEEFKKYLDQYKPSNSEKTAKLNNLKQFFIDHIQMDFPEVYSLDEINRICDTVLGKEENQFLSKPALYLIIKERLKEIKKKPKGQRKSVHIKATVSAKANVEGTKISGHKESDNDQNESQIKRNMALLKNFEKTNL